MKRRVIVLLGPPGSGKGTQASLLAGRLRIPAISTGNILRRECETGTPLGNTVGALLAAGELVPDDLVNQVVAGALAHPDARRGFLLDGYPRTVPQAVYLDRLLDSLGMPRPTVVQIEVPTPVLVKRLTGRLQCPACGRSYRIHTEPTDRRRCEDDGAALVRRSDDSEIAIRERLRLYAETSAPLIGYYGGSNLYHIDGTGAPDTVLAALESALGIREPAADRAPTVRANDQPPRAPVPVSSAGTLLEQRTGGDSH